jgi:hypothetical protein
MNISDKGQILRSPYQQNLYTTHHLDHLSLSRCLCRPPNNFGFKCIWDCCKFEEVSVPVKDARIK